MAKQNLPHRAEDVSRHADETRTNPPRTTRCAETSLMFCPACGFPLTELDPDQRCIQCGHRACPSCSD